MRRLPFLLLFCLLNISILSIAQEAEPTATPTVPPPIRPVTVISASSNGITFERLFASLTQGQVGLIRLTGENIQEARVLFRNREFPFYSTPDDGWYGFVVADIDAQPRDYPLSVIARTNEGVNITFNDNITVETSNFIRQVFEVPSTLGYLIDPEVERNEFARLDALFDDLTTERQWSGERWTLPIGSEFSSGFGQYRILNEAVQTRHTGWDQSAPIGTPVSAMMDGTVAYAEQLDIRGNYVLIDHGWGVFTGYAHFSQMYVQIGQTVVQGEIIGESGNTGRSNGPHLHWELVVNGEWVDGVQFLDTWLP